MVVYIIASLLLCEQPSLSKALELAGSNRGELERYLSTIKIVGRNIKQLAF